MSTLGSRGLGLGNLLDRNASLLAKWLWRFPREPNSLWHFVICLKYVLESRGIGSISNGRFLCHACGLVSVEFSHLTLSTLGMIQVVEIGLGFGKIFCGVAPQAPH